MNVRVDQRQEWAQILDESWRVMKYRFYDEKMHGKDWNAMRAKYEPLLAFMALRTGRPVRLVLTLEETFQAVRRGAAQVHVRSGFRRDGREFAGRCSNVQRRGRLRPNWQCTA